MNLEDVKSLPKRERRTCRANVRLYPSQMKFIKDNNASVQAIFDRALEELGHIPPAPEDIDKIARLFNQDVPERNKSIGRGRGGKGNVPRQRKSVKTRRKVTRGRR